MDIAALNQERIEALTRAENPDIDALVELLSCQQPALRSRAVRVLHKWYPEEALRHFNAMLASESRDSRRAALADAFFLPFAQIKKAVLRFIYHESDSELIRQAGNLLITNPEPDVAVHFAAIMVQRRCEAVPIFREIFSRLLEFLVKAGTLAEAGAEVERQLLESARQKLFQKLSQNANRQPAGENAALLKHGIELNIETVAADELRRLSAQLEAIVGELPPPMICALIERRVELKIEGTVAWLKKVLQSTMPAEVYAGVISGLAVLDPDFLKPHLAKLLQHSDSRIQTAALSALARIQPSRAEKLLRQYLFSTIIERRKTGYRLLSIIEASFSEQLFIQAFKTETEKSLLDFATEIYIDNWDQHLVDALYQTGTPADAAGCHKNSLIESICRQKGLSLQVNRDAPEIDPAMLLENIELVQADKVCSNESGSSADSTELPLQHYAEATTIEKFLLLSRIALGNGGGDTLNRLEEFIEAENDSLLEFALQVCRQELLLQRQADFTPANLLRESLNTVSPNFLMAAAAMSAITAPAARLAAAALPVEAKIAFPDEIMPYVLMFIRKSQNPMYTGPAVAALQHGNPLVRYFAIDCLDVINPEELRPYLAEILADSDSSVHLRAVRVLAKWDKEEALKYFAAALASSDGHEVAAALKCGFFFDFTDISGHVVEFAANAAAGKNLDAALKILLANPDYKTLRNLFFIASRSDESRKPQLESAVETLIETLCRSGMVAGRAQELRQQLNDELQKARNKERQFFAALEAGKAADLLEAWSCSKVGSERIQAVNSLRRLDLPSMRPILFSMIAKENDPEVLAAIATFLENNPDRQVIEELHFLIVNRQISNKDFFEKLLNRIAEWFCQKHNLPVEDFLAELQENSHARIEKQKRPPAYSYQKIRSGKAETKPDATGFDAGKAKLLIGLGAVFIVVAFFYWGFSGAGSKPVKTPPPAAPTKESKRFSRWQDKPETGQERIIFGRVIKADDRTLTINSTALKRIVMIVYPEKAPMLPENSHFSGRVRIESMNSEKIKATYLADK